MAELRLAFLLAVTSLVALGMSGRLAFVAHEFRGRVRQIVALLLFVLILCLSVFYPLAAFGHANPIDPEIVWFPALFAGHVLLSSFLLGWWLLSGRPDLRTFLALPPQDLRSTLRAGVTTGVLGWAITLVTTGVVAACASLVTELPQSPPHVPAVMIWMAQLPVSYKLTVIAAAMTIEEVFFRAFLQRRLGLWLSSLLFAIAHFSYGLPYLVVAVLTISLIIGTLFRRTGNLVPCIIAHGVFDAIQLLIILPIAVQLSGSS